MQIQQAPMNLMLNAIEAMKEADGMLTARTGRGEVDQLMISVSDNGVGVPAERANSLCENNPSHVIRCSPLHMPSAMLRTRALAQ